MTKQELRNRVARIRSKIGALANEVLAVKVAGYESPIDLGTIDEMTSTINSWENELLADATKVEFKSGSIISFNDSPEENCKKEVSWNNKNFLKFFGL